MPMIRSALTLLILFSQLSACAYSRLNDDGSQTHIGIMYLTIPAPDMRQAGFIVETTTIGALGIISPLGAELALGFSTERIGILNDNSLAVLPITSED